MVACSARFEKEWEDSVSYEPVYARGTTGG
jgi:hypothetical protein